MRIQVETVSWKGNPKKHWQQCREVKWGKEEKTAINRFVIKLVTTEDEWSLILLGSPGASIENASQGYVT